MKSSGSFKKIIFLSTFIFLVAAPQVKADPVGALIGGIAGAQFGQGNGKLAMAIIGAVAGDMVTNQVSNVPSGYGYQTAYYAPPVYSYGQGYYENPAPRVYYNPPVVPQVYYPTPAYIQPYQTYRRDGDRWHEQRHYRENSYREYREHDNRRDWR